MVYALSLEEAAKAIDPQDLFTAHQPRAEAVVTAYLDQVNPAVAYLRQDIWSEAMMALWSACLRFKQTDNNTFWTFAYLRVKGSITDYLRREKLQVRGDRLDTQVQFLSLDATATKSCNVCQSGTNSDWVVATSSRLDSDGMQDNWFEDTKSESERHAIEVRHTVDQAMKSAGLTAQEAAMLDDYYAKGKTISELSTEMAVDRSIAYRSITTNTHRVRAASLA